MQYSEWKRELNYRKIGEKKNDTEREEHDAENKVGKSGDWGKSRYFWRGNSRFNAFTLSDASNLGGVRLTGE